MITIKDVAREAGVSYSTVSVVLGNRTTKLPIAEKTRRRVIECASKIGYRRNALASQMITGKTNFIAFVTETIRYEFVSRAISTAVKEAEANGFYLKLVCNDDILDDEIKRRRRIDRLLEQRPVGIVIKNFIQDGDYLIQAAHECEIPVVALDSSLNHGDALILSDDNQGISRAVEYLHRFGHRRLGFLSSRLVAGKFSSERYRVFLETIKKLGMESRPDWCCFIDYYHNQHIREFFADLFSGRGEKPTAFCSVSDLIALKALTSLQRLGIRVPEEVSLIGYGGIHFTELTDPVLTTVFQNFEEMGRLSVKYIMDFVNNKNKEHLHLVIPTEILEGESVAEAKKGERL